MLRIPHCLQKRLTDGGEVISLMRQPRFTIRKISWYSLKWKHSMTSRKEEEKKIPWPESARELCLYRPSDRPLSAKLVPASADRGLPRCQRNGSLRLYSRFSRPEPLLFLQAAPQLYSRGWVDPVREPLVLRKSGSAGNRTRNSDR
jgi:hypothetical protein